MRKAQVLFSIFALLSVGVMALTPKGKEAMGQTGQEAGPVDPDLEKGVDEALEAIEGESPQVHKDSLRVWKDFSPESNPVVNFTYRFWGRHLILWLKKEKKIAFQSEEQVGEVFKILWRKGLISQHAVVVLMVDAWSYLVYLEGSPSWEKRSLEGGTASDGSTQRKPPERAI